MPSGIRSEELAIGEKRGCLTVIEFFERNYKYNGKNQRQYLAKCKCEHCGKTRSKFIGEILRNLDNCGRRCLKEFDYSFVPKERFIVDINQKFGMLLTISEPFFKKHYNKNYRVQWSKVECQCDKKTIFEVECGKLKNGNTSSCGCVGIEKHRKGTLANNGIKQCSSCKEYKSIELFNKYNKSYDGLRSICVDCGYELTLKREYNLTMEQYQTILKNQDYKCKICKSDYTGRKHTKYFNVDHCHTTGKIRGLLCYGCNAALGLFRDSVDSLKEAILYLENKESII